MFFGLALSLRGWLALIAVSFVLVISPLIFIEAFAKSLPEPIGFLVYVLLGFVAMPALMCFLHYRKMFKVGSGSILFRVYCGVYMFLAFFITMKLFSVGPSFQTVLGALVTCGVSGFMVWFAMKTKKDLSGAVAQAHDAAREDDIQRQAEAILRAEEMKKQQEQS